MPTYGKPEFVTVRCDGDDYAGLVADWDRNMIITEDFEFVVSQQVVSRTFEANTDTVFHMSKGMPVTYRGPEAVGTIPAHIVSFDEHYITIRDARSPFTMYEYVTVESLSYRMNYDAVLPSGDALECTIDTLYRVARHDGLKIVTNPSHLSDCPPRYWVVPNTSNDRPSKTIKAFGPGELWTRARTPTAKLLHFVQKLKKHPPHT
jgi:hypothetical protein